jgi:hypothetical protein
MHITRWVTTLGLALAMLALGCNESHSITDDTGIVTDAAPPTDAPPVDAPRADTGGGDAGIATDAAIDLDAPGADSGPAEACTTPGAFENVACGTCGTVDRFCTSAFVWEYGTCEMAADAVCTPGETGTTPCGTMCGTQTARCDTSCHWISSGACTGGGVCIPGMTERTMGGCTGGETRGRGCNAMCAWSDYSACMAAPTDFDGDGAPYDLDCDDTTAAIHPGSTRACGSFRCAGMAMPSAGTQTCAGPGWGDCVRPCPEVVPCVNGTTESRDCATGGCDVDAIETRVCSAMAWGAWSGCDPVTTRPASCDPTTGSACGTCGEGVTYAICDGACMTATTSCFGRGCTPGTRARDVAGCTTGEYRETTCDSTCMAGSPGACMAFPPEVDILLVVDVTGSHTGVVMANASILATELAGSVLADADVRVGVTRFADFMESPYGGPGDEPFAGILAPTSDSSMVTMALTTLPGMGGGDGPEAGMEALWVIAGGMPHPESHPFTCAAGLVSGGCWRPAAQRAVILITDIAQHNAPHPALSGGALLEPYTGVTPAPPVWSAVRDQMVSEGIALFAIVPSTTGWFTDSYEVVPQMELLVTEVGQDPSQSIAIYPAGETDWTVVSREMAMMLATYLGLMP